MEVQKLRRYYGAKALRSLITASVKFSVIAGVDGRSRLVKRPTLKFTDKEERYLLERRTRVELTPPSSRASLIL